MEQSHQLHRTFAGALAAGLALFMGGCQEQMAPESTETVGAVALAVVGSQFLDHALISGLTKPTLMDMAPDGRIFISELAGKLRVVKNNVLLPVPFVTVNVATGGEMGLLGVALDPEHALNRFVYVYYTSAEGPRNRVSRFTASAANPDEAEPGSEVVILDLPISTTHNHNAGMIRFGVDGKLYIATGDNAYGINSQSLGTTFGKLLRINKDGTIPTDNPFYYSTSGSNRSIYALGLRNPFSFAIQPGTGRIFANDVGLDLYEEINEVQRGGNYGWPFSEGYKDTAGYKGPIHAYQHDVGCSITGGDFYNPAQPRFPADMVGDYFFTDFCGKFIRRMDLATGTVSLFATAVNATTGLQVGKDGAIYYLEYKLGVLRRIVSKPPSTVLEAETSVRSGPVVSTAAGGFTGTGFLDFQGATGDWVEFRATLTYPTTVPLTLRYANGSGAPIPVKVTLNGANLNANLPLAPTGSWSSWGEVTANISLPAGLIAIRVTTLGTGDPHIDHLRAH